MEPYTRPAPSLAKPNTRPMEDAGTARSRSFLLTSDLRSSTLSRLTGPCAQRVMFGLSWRGITVLVVCEWGAPDWVMYTIESALVDSRPRPKLLEWLPLQGCSCVGGCKPTAIRPESEPRESSYLLLYDQVPRAVSNTPCTSAGDAALHCRAEPFLWSKLLKLKHPPETGAVSAHTCTGMSRPSLQNPTYSNPRP